MDGDTRTTFGFSDNDAITVEVSKECLRNFRWGYPKNGLMGVKNDPKGSYGSCTR